MNYDGLPSTNRRIFVPVYQDEKMIGELRIDDWDDDIYRPYIDFSKTPCPTDADFYPGLIDDGRATLMYTDFYKRTESCVKWEYAKQGYDCLLYTSHFDHILAYAKGGKSILSNCQILCIDCNLSKSNKEMNDFLLEEKAKRFMSGETISTDTVSYTHL